MFSKNLLFEFNCKVCGYRLVVPKSLKIDDIVKCSCGALYRLLDGKLIQIK